MKKKHLDATAEITAEATKDLRSFQLDLQGLRVSDVRVDGKDAAFSRKGHKLIGPAGRRPPQGRASSVRRVNYGGTPQELKDPDGSREGWVKTADGAFVSGEPAGAMTWFPGNNHPGDKATYDFEITVPKGYTAVANGELRSEKTAKGRTTFEWHNGAADGQLSRHRRHRQVRCPAGPVRPTGCRCMSRWIRRRPRRARKPLERLPEIVKWESGLFGPYPFSSAGAIVDHTPARINWIALESQTKPVYAGAPDTSTVVHEMAHQWFGDSVTPKTWKDTWLNEGFATYAEWLWEEREGGKTPAAAVRRALRGQDGRRGAGTSRRAIRARRRT